MQRPRPGRKALHKRGREGRTGGKPRKTRPNNTPIHMKGKSKPRHSPRPQQHHRHTNAAAPLPLRPPAETAEEYQI